VVEDGSKVGINFPSDCATDRNDSIGVLPVVTFTVSAVLPPAFLTLTQLLPESGIGSAMLPRGLVADADMGTGDLCLRLLLLLEEKDTPEIKEPTARMDWLPIFERVGLVGVLGVVGVVGVIVVSVTAAAAAAVAAAVVVGVGVDAALIDISLASTIIGICSANRGRFIVKAAVAAALLLGDRVSCCGGGCSTEV
jgi:hypothetical protein